MPIVSSDQFTDFKPRIVRHVRNLVNTGALRFSAAHGASLTLGFAFDVQWVSTEPKTSRRFGDPGGIGVLLLYEQEVIASLYLHFSGQRWRFSHAQKGRSLDNLVAGMNMLEARYKEDRKPYSIVQLHFPIGPELYFKVFGGGSATLFQFENGLLRTMKTEELKTRFTGIIKNRKPLTPKL